jgi:hypothetical protein
MVLLCRQGESILPPRAERSNPERFQKKLLVASLGSKGGETPRPVP